MPPTTTALLESISIGPVRSTFEDSELLEELDELLSELAESEESSSELEELLSSSSDEELEDSSSSLKEELELAEEEVPALTELAAELVLALELAELLLEEDEELAWGFCSTTTSSASTRLFASLARKVAVTRSVSAGRLVSAAWVLSPWPSNSSAILLARGESRPKVPVSSVRSASPVERSVTVTPTTGALFSAMRRPLTVTPPEPEVLPPQ
jgi:hypothetical protein